MRYHLPKGCAGVSHAGRALAIAPDGTVDVEPGAGVLLAPHGLLPASEPSAPDPKRDGSQPIDPKPIDPRRVDMLSRAELVAALAARGSPAPAAADVAMLRGALRRALARSK